MRIDFDDYKKLVIATYNQMQLDGTLSMVFHESRPGKIKKECLRIYKIRQEKKDERDLKLFFETEQSVGNLYNVIKNFDVDKFKPINNYINGDTDWTEDKNINLLAWLIDFKYRPFIFDMSVDLDEQEVEIIKKREASLRVSDRIVETPIDPDPGENPIDEPGVIAPPQNPKPVDAPISNPPSIPTGQTPPPIRTWVKRIAAGLILTSGVLLGGNYMVGQWKNPQDSRCMYWNGDRYVETSCDIPQSGRLVLPFNKEKMENFRRIVRVDTITESSIGKLFYIQNNGGYEFYTAGGMHPIETSRYLRKLTNTVFNSQLRKP